MDFRLRSGHLGMGRTSVTVLFKDTGRGPYSMIASVPGKVAQDGVTALRTGTSSSSSYE